MAALHVHADLTGLAEEWAIWERACVEASDLKMA
jgi:hypothetical protein